MDNYQQYHRSEIREDPITHECPITGQQYRVTRWVERGDRIIALEKEPLEVDDE